MIKVAVMELLMSNIPAIVRKGALAASLALVVFASPVPSGAGAPVAAAPAPAFQRMVLGDFAITAISDGTVALDAAKLLKSATPSRIDAALGRVFLTEPVQTSVNAFLINTGTKLILVDAGTGNLFGPTLGKLVANLAAAGYTPDQVDEIYITHFHPDHVGGLTSSDGSAVFPKAIVRADRRESEFWLSEAVAKRAPKSGQSFFDGARKSLAPYVKSGRYKPFDGPAVLTPGIRALSTTGHTPGHASYVVTSRGQRLVIWGDLVHVAAIQFADPDVAITFDANSKAAIAARKAAFADAATHRDWVAAAHISFPGLGHVTNGPHGYLWIPANYAPVIGAK